jgi:hypothetical protein
VHINDNAYWSCIPLSAWEFKIGGHQVLKKWLSYREQSVIGRALSVEEVREFSNLARRLTRIVTLGGVLDENYVRARDHSFLWLAG